MLLLQSKTKVNVDLAGLSQQLDQLKELIKLKIINSLVSLNNNSLIVILIKLEKAIKDAMEEIWD